MSGALADPQLTIATGPVSFGPYTAWGGNAADAQAFVEFGAFPLPSNSADAVFYAGNGAFVAPSTALVTGLNGTSGVALVEAYTENYQFINVSTRAYVGTGADILIAGFVIGGNVPEKVLIRGVGPSLSQFGLSGLLAKPQLALFDADGNPLQANNGWGGSPSLAAVFSGVGAFALLTGSADCAMVVTLPPGNYTAELLGASGTTGVGLVEVYTVQ